MRHRRPSFHRWSCVRLLVCSDGSDTRTAAPRLLYIYSRRRGSKTRPLFILLGITLSYKVIMADWAQIMDKNLTYCVSWCSLWTDSELINVLSVTRSCLFLQPLLTVWDPFSEHEGDFSGVFLTRPTVQKHGGVTFFVSETHTNPLWLLLVRRAVIRIISWSRSIIICTMHQTVIGP